MEEIRKIIEDLNASRERMRDLLIDVDTSKIIYPEWTMKHVLAHLTGWEEVVHAALEAHLRGGTMKINAFRGIDAYNESTVAERELLSLEQIRREWEMERTRVLEALDMMTPEKWNVTITLPWGDEGQVRDMLDMLIEHENHHVNEIRGIVSGNNTTNS